MAIKNDHYTYRVTWSADDDEYVGLCAELPSLSWLAETPESALKGIRNIVADVIEDMKNNKEKIPEPIAIKNYSGKFMVRVPPDVHRELEGGLIEHLDISLPSLFTIQTGINEPRYASLIKIRRNLTSNITFKQLFNQLHNKNLNFPL